MLKGTRVDGIYTADPEKDPTAKKFDKISYDDLYPWIKGHGPHSDHPLQRKPSAHYRIRYGYGRKPEKSIVRREHRDSGILNPVLYGYS